MLSFKKAHEVATGHVESILTATQDPVDAVLVATRVLRRRANSPRQR
jgi:ABC-type cobalt transport system substrate-binding protein